MRNHQTLQIGYERIETSLKSEEARVKDLQEKLVNMEKLDQSKTKKVTELEQELTTLRSTTFQSTTDIR